MDFASDNAAGVPPAMLNALARANAGHALGYGDDDLTRAVTRRLTELFERDVAVFLVTTGTAANALALAQLSPPWGAVLCHRQAHIITDECGAPEFFGSGLRLVPIDGAAGKLAAGDVERTLANGLWGGPHRQTPSMLSLTQATEAGTVYTPSETAALAEVAQRAGMAVHMDGARFANAVARLGVGPAAATWQAGVDVLSFGATKGGALAAEAIIFFDPDKARGMNERRKRAGHLLSKHRFVAAQWLTYLEDDLWLRLATHANALAERLADALAAAGAPPIWPVEANEVFVVLTAEADQRLRGAGARYYVRGWGDAEDESDCRRVARLVTSFATSADEVDRFAAILREAGG